MCIVVALVCAAQCWMMLLVVMIMLLLVLLLWLVVFFVVSLFLFFLFFFLLLQRRRFFSQSVYNETDAQQLSFTVRCPLQTNSITLTYQSYNYTCSIWYTTTIEQCTMSFLRIFTAWRVIQIKRSNTFFSGSIQIRLLWMNE